MSDAEVDAAIAEAVENATSSTSTSTTSTTVTTTTVPESTTTTLSEEQIAQLEFDEDVAKIKKLWRDMSDSWFEGLDAGYDFLATHNHPDSACTREMFEDHYRWPDEYGEEIVIDASTIERDDGWRVPLGPDGLGVPRGRIYIHQATITSDHPGQVDTPWFGEIHTVIFGGASYLSRPCSEDY
jgi:hypothetical protein